MAQQNKIWDHSRLIAILEKYLKWKSGAWLGSPYNSKSYIGICGYLSIFITNPQSKKGWERLAFLNIFLNIALLLFAQGTPVKSFSKLLPSSQMQFFCFPQE